MVTIRGAGSSDIDRIVEIIHGVPFPEALALAGTADLAREFEAGLVRLDRIPNKDKPTVVAVDGDCIVGVLQYRVGGHATPITLDHVKLALSVFGPVGTLKRLPRLRARTKVDLPTPANSFYIAELDVDPLRRGRGIGGQLLSWAVDEAHRCGIVNMSLHTTTANPARRLYERHGFVVTQTAVDRRYEAYTGIGGRLLMERRRPVVASRSDGDRRRERRVRRSERKTPLAPTIAPTGPAPRASGTPTPGARAEPCADAESALLPYRPPRQVLRTVRVECGSRGDMHDARAVLVPPAPSPTSTLRTQPLSRTSTVNRP